MEFDIVEMLQDYGITALIGLATIVALPLLLLGLPFALIGAATAFTLSRIEDRMNGVESTK